VDDVADIDLAEADHAVDRCGDGGVIELDLRRLDGGLVGIDRRREMIDLGLLQIDILLVSKSFRASVVNRARSFCASTTGPHRRFFFARFWSSVALNGAGSIRARTSPWRTSCP